MIKQINSTEIKKYKNIKIIYRQKLKFSYDNHYQNQLEYCLLLFRDKVLKSRILL